MSGIKQIKVHSHSDDPARANPPKSVRLKERSRMERRTSHQERLPWAAFGAREGHGACPHCSSTRRKRFNSAIATSSRFCSTSAIKYSTSMACARSAASRGITRQRTLATSKCWFEQQYYYINPSISYAFPLCKMDRSHAVHQSGSMNARMLLPHARCKC